MCSVLTVFQRDLPTKLLRYSEMCVYVLLKLKKKTSTWTASTTQVRSKDIQAASNVTEVILSNRKDSVSFDFKLKQTSLFIFLR